MKDLRAYLLEFTDYDKQSGKLTWKKRTGRHHTVKIGSELGIVNSGGYRKTKIKGKTLLVHRLIWLRENGILPKYIDHINGDRLDNRLENLRPASGYDNNSNRTYHRAGKLFGTTFKKSTGRWASKIFFAKKEIHLGYFDTEREAHQQYLKAKELILTKENECKNLLFKELLDLRQNSKTCNPTKTTKTLQWLLGLAA